MSLRKPSQVSPTTGRLQGVLAVLRRGDQRVADDADGVRVGQPDRRRHKAGVADPLSPVGPPLPLILWQPAKSDSGGGRTTVTPVRSCRVDQRRVPDPVIPSDIRDRVPSGRVRAPVDLDSGPCSRGSRST